MRKYRWPCGLAFTLAAVLLLIGTTSGGPGTARAAQTASGNSAGTGTDGRAGTDSAAGTGQTDSGTGQTGGDNAGNSSGSTVNEQPNTSLTVTPSNANALVLMDVGAQSPRGVPGNVVDVVLPIAVNREYLPSERYVLRNITITPVISGGTSGSSAGSGSSSGTTASRSTTSWPFDIIDASYTRHLDDMSYNSTAEVWYKFRISEFAQKGVYPVNFRVNATVWRQDDANGTSITEDVTFTLGVYVTVVDDGGLSGVTSAISPLEIGGFGDGIVNSSPVTQPGQSITLTLPIINKGGYLSRLTISPVISSNIEDFPFVVDKLAYGITMPDMNTGDTQTFTYTFNVSPKATTGNKPVTFRASYEENGIAGECTFTAYIYITNGYEEPKEITETPPVATLESYQMLVGGREVEFLNAGDEALIVMNFKNNSVKSTIIATSATVTINDPTALALTIGSSDTDYLGSLQKEETGDAEFHVTVPANAPAGPTTVTVNLTYENQEMLSKTVTQNIMIPIKQPMNVLIDAPVVYGTPKTGEAFAVGLNIVNMGRAKIMNVSVNATDGVSMAENYFGGDILPAASLNADVELLTGQTGEFTGTLLVTYEDSDGEQYTQYIDLPLNVVQTVEPAPVPVTEPEAKKSSMSGGAIAGWGAATLISAGALGAGGYQIWRKKKGMEGLGFLAGKGISGLKFWNRRNKG